MNTLGKFILKGLRKLYVKIFNASPLPKLECEEDPDIVSKLIYNQLMAGKPCMIARFGAIELAAMINYLGVKQKKAIPLKYIKSSGLQWWWNERILFQMQNNTGFFPSTAENVEQFCELMINDTGELDVLGSWLVGEHYFKDQLKDVLMVQREIQNPFFTDNPWTRALEGKKVLVIHPFAPLIEQQYELNREKLFENKSVLPEFELKTIQAVQSMGGKHPKYKSWFEALQDMMNQMDYTEYDIALIGCGSYGFPLSAHAKRTGKKAVHLGGSLQLLFGIKGKRWEDPNYNRLYNYSALMNEYWVRPDENLRPKNAESVEGACYW